MRRLRKRLAAEMKALRGANALAVIQRLNPIIRGWSAYYRTVVSSQAFARLDNYMWTLTYKWAKHSHPNKSKRWVVDRYFGNVQPVPARPLGLRRPRQRRLPAQVRLDQDRPAPVGAQERRHLTTRPWPTTGPGGDGATHHRWTASACAYSRRSTVAAQSVGGLLLLADREPQGLRRMGAVALGDPQSGPPDRRSPPSGTLTRRTSPPRSVLYTPSASGGAAAAGTEPSVSAAS